MNENKSVTDFLREITKGCGVVTVIPDRLSFEGSFKVRVGEA